MVRLVLALSLPLLLPQSAGSLHKLPKTAANAPSAKAVPAARPTAAYAPAGEWVSADPDKMVEIHQRRAVEAEPAAALASLAILRNLEDRASYGKVAQALGEIAKSAKSVEIREEARLLGRSRAEDRYTPGAQTTDRQGGIVKDLAILGPFRDTGGGLERKDGPEGSLAAFADKKTTYSWGTMLVSWRTVPPAFATAEGVPLDLLIHPRRESCTLLASKVTIDADKTFVVRVASAGQVRATFDGAELGRSEDVNALGLFDRVAGKVTAKAGTHLLAVKVCSGALDDSGRVRIRTTTPTGEPLALPESPDVGAPTATSTVEKVALPLTAALGAGDPLAAAVLRTAGGADDLRSPRAPGIFSTITASASDQVLAIAGALAPSGANRSAYLHRIERDESARAYRDRRLVEEHARADLADWAMASAQGMGLPAKTDAASVLLFSQVQQALRSDALRMMAYRGLAGYFAGHERTAPTALLQSLLGMASPLDRNVARAVATELARRERDPVSTVALRGEPLGAAGLGQTALTAFQGRIASIDEGLRLGRIVAAGGPPKDATAIFEALAYFAPNRSDVWSEVAGNRSREGQSERYFAALRRARDLDPGNAHYRAELALRTQEKSDSRADERYLVPSETILARRQGIREGSANVADRQLYWLRAVTMHPDMRVSQLIQYAREIVIAPRTQDELFEEIPQEGDLTEILRARVHRKGGGIAYPTEEHNDGRRPRIRWPDLVPGDTVEVAVRSWTSSAIGGRGDAPFYFVDYAGAPSTHPLLYNEVIVDSPKSRPIHVDVVRGGAFQKTEKNEGDHTIVRLVWEKPPVFPEEPLSPPLSETAPLIVGSTYANWDEFRKWYAEAVKGFTEPDEEVRKIAADLTKKETTKEGKLRVLFNFVADSIRYVNFVSGEWWLPNRPQQLLARREGDCDDKAILLISLLKAVGIEAQEVLVQTRLTGMPSVVRAPGAAIPMFDHGIAFLPGPGGGTYLDATSPESRLGPLPSMDARAMALRMAGPAEIVSLPPSNPGDHGADVTWKIALRQDGGGSLQASEVHRGDSSFWLRTALRQEETRLQYVQDNLVAGWFSNLTVDKKIEFDGDGAQGVAKVRYSAASEAGGGFARDEGEDLVVRLAPTSTLASSLASLPRRTLPVQLPPNLAPSKQVRTFVFEAPKGYTFTGVPDGGKEDGGELGQAKLTVKKDPSGKTVTVERTVIFDADRVPVEKYPAFRAWLLRVDALMHKSLRLTRVAARAGGAQ